jgi:hypothetical protein
MEIAKKLSSKKPIIASRPAGAREVPEQPNLTPLAWLAKRRFSWQP